MYSMEKKFIFPIVAGVMILVLGAIFFVIPKSGSLSSSNNDNNQIGVVSADSLDIQTKTNLSRQSVDNEEGISSDYNIDEWTITPNQIK